MPRTALLAEIRLFLTVLLLTAPLPSLAVAMQSRHAVLCDQATTSAAREFGVPDRIMKAIARTESGVTVAGSFISWPWTINVEGRGVRLGSREEAVSYFQRSFAAGARNIDVGCFQVNHKWHGRAFHSIETMLDPVANARYAAKFLKELYDETGDWITAAGAYHSRNKSFSDKYLSKFIPILNGLDDASPPKSILAQAPPRPANNFPLLQGSAHSAANGSLFPTNSSGRGSLLSRRDERG